MSHTPTAEQSKAQVLLDPKLRPRGPREHASPGRMPIAIGGGTVVALVLGLSVTSPCSPASDGSEVHAVRSSHATADELTAGFEAGEVPAVGTPVGAFPGQGAQGADWVAGGDAGVPAPDSSPSPSPNPSSTAAEPEQAASGLLGAAPDSLGGPPLPPRLQEAAELGSPGEPEPTNGPSPLERPFGAKDQVLGEGPRDTGLTAGQSGTENLSAQVAANAGAPGDALAAQLAARQSGGTYMEKLELLKQSGLLATPAPEEPRKGGRGFDAYANLRAEEGASRWAHPERVEDPSAFELTAGAVIPAVLQTGINSDVPGQVAALVSQDVRDSATGRHVLIPQGARLVGVYGSDVNFGQERLLVGWQRIVFPDGKRLDIGSMPGTDGAGYAGLKDQVNTHFWRVLSSALIMSGITGGISLSQGDNRGSVESQGMGNVMAQALGQQLGQVSEEAIRRQMNVAPTIEIRPGYRLQASVTRDLVFEGPYVGFDYNQRTGRDMEVQR